MAMVELEPVPAEEAVNARFYHHRTTSRPHGRVEILTDMTRFDAERLRYLIGQHAPLHRLEARRRNSRRLEDLVRKIPQGDAGRISPRAQGNGRPQQAAAMQAAE